MINKNFLPLSLSFVIWSSWLIPIRLIGEGTITIIFFTSFFAALFWGIILYNKKKHFFTLKKNKISGLFLLSLFFMLNMLCYLGALKYTDASIAVLTHYTAPIFVAFLATFFLKEKITKEIIFALIIAATGFITIFFKKESSSAHYVLGTLLGFASGLFYALIIIVAKKMIEIVDNEELLFAQNFFGAILVLLLFRFINFKISPKTGIILIFISLLYSVIASYMYINALKKIEGTKVAIIGYVEPVGTILWGWLFFKESITIKTVLGALLILYSGYKVASVKSVE